MLIAQKARHPSLLKDGLEQLTGDCRLEQPMAALADCRAIPQRPIDRQYYEPSEQNVVLELLDQQTLAADRMQNLLQQCPNQPLGCNARSARLGALLLQLPIHIPPRREDHPADRPQPMLRWNSLFRGDVAEHRLLLRVRSTHRRTSIVRQILPTFLEEPFY